MSKVVLETSPSASQVAARQVSFTVELGEFFVLLANWRRQDDHAVGSLGRFGMMKGMCCSMISRWTISHR
jgi:hypothetical protein